MPYNHDLAALSPIHSPQTRFLGSRNVYHGHPSPSIPAHLHPEYEEAFSDWVTISDTIAGQTTIKAKSTTYLPMLEDQESSEYIRYLQNAIYFNMVERTRDGLLSSIFRKQPQLTEIPDHIKEEPISDEGEHIHSFLKRTTKELISLGRCGILVDRPNIPSSNNPKTTKPYFVLYSAFQIINWRTSINPETGLRELTLVLLHETDEAIDPEDPMGIKTKKINRLRLLALDDNHEYYQQTATFEDPSENNRASQNTPDTIPWDNRTYPTKRGQRFKHIPFFFLNSMSTGAATEKPPLLEIAHLNIAHYQTYATLQHGRFYTAMPTYYHAGTATADESQSPESQRYKVGPSRVWLLDTEDEVGILEFRGSGLSYLENALEILERQIQALGARLVSHQRKSPAQSETLLSQQEMGERASLLSITSNLNHAFTSIIRFWMFWEEHSESETKKAKVEFNQSFKERDFDARDLRAIQTLSKEQLIPISILFNVYRAADIVPPDMDLDDFKKALNSAEDNPPPQNQPQNPQNPDDPNFNTGNRPRNRNNNDGQEPPEDPRKEDQDNPPTATQGERTTATKSRRNQRRQNS